MKEHEIARILVAKHEKTATRNELALLEEWMIQNKANRVFIEKEYYMRAQKRQSQLFTKVQQNIRDQFAKLMQALYREWHQDSAELEINSINEFARLMVLELKKDILPTEKAALRKLVNSDKKFVILYALIMGDDHKRLTGIIAFFLMEQLEELSGTKRDLIIRKSDELYVVNDH